MSFVAVVVLFTLAAMFSDLRTRRIPNWLTVPACVLAIVVHTTAKAVAGEGLDGLYFSLLGFFAGFGVLFVLWLLGGGGGGDVKMMAALGAWLGWELTVQVFLVSAVVTLAIAGGRLVAAVSMDGYAKVRQRFSAQAGTPEPAARLETPRRRGLVPYAVPVALSTWIVLAVAWKTGGLLP